MDPNSLALNCENVMSITGAFCTVTSFSLGTSCSPALISSSVRWICQKPGQGQRLKTRSRSKEKFLVTPLNLYHQIIFYYSKLSQWNDNIYMHALKRNYELYLDDIFAWFDLGTEFVVITSGDWLGIRALPLGVVDDPSVSWPLDAVGELPNDNLTTHIKPGNCQHINDYYIIV